MSKSAVLLVYPYAWSLMIPPDWSHCADVPRSSKWPGDTTDQLLPCPSSTIQSPIGWIFSFRSRASNLPASARCSSGRLRKCL